MIWFWFGFMMFNATFNNFLVISWQSVLLVEKTTDLSHVTDKLSHEVVHRALSGIRTPNISGDRHRLYQSLPRVVGPYERV
jgi:hypothetical protein